MIDLPGPDAFDGIPDIPLAAAIRNRESRRAYTDAALTLEELAFLLWAAQGVTHPRGLRTAPSAGALYPLEIYVVAGNVTGIAPGVYHYQIPQHRLQQQIAEDKRIGLGRASHWQTWMAKAAVIIVFAAEYERTARKYGVRAKRYVHMEVGHAAQNLFLQAEDLGLATVVVGGILTSTALTLIVLPCLYMLFGKRTVADQ